MSWGSSAPCPKLETQHTLDLCRVGINLLLPCAQDVFIFLSQDKPEEESSCLAVPRRSGV